MKCFDRMGLERSLTTMGEAMNIIIKIAPDAKITNAKRMVDVKDKITHGHDEIDSLRIWNIIVSHLPVLKQEVRNLLPK